MKQLVGIILLILAACNGPAEEQNALAMEEQMNKLANSSSPYLLQHASNPVNWYPWGDEALQKARDEDKPIIVSIGYSSCHWCHVMEKESFENDSIAAIMNEHFISIKVDREERPDIDQIYMDAVQAMGLQGGWPLNVFLTPDQKPFYGGTYFPPKNWAQLLTNIHQAFTEKRDEIEKSAGQLTDAIGMSELLRYKLKRTSSPYEAAQQQAMFAKLSSRFDTLKGGQDRVPKFPMPSIWEWLLQYGVLDQNEEAISQVHRTLRAMAFGGIYDQVGGGFARYSTDGDWLVPHFEKMLYDNAQLLALYAHGYMNKPDEVYEEVIRQTVDWLREEMMSDEGGFYSALDADSEGVEGKYYVWSFREFQDVVGDDAPLLSSYFQVSAEGNWEDVNILHRKMDDAGFARRKELDKDTWIGKKESALRKLKLVRSTRIKPGLDNKIITGWNAMTISGLLAAYDAIGDESYLELAMSNANFLVSHSYDNGHLFRTPPTPSTKIDGYLEDYAFTIGAFVDLYERTFDEKWLDLARSVTSYVYEHFNDDAEDMFFYTDDSSHDLVVRKKEIFDNVIPSSNSEMAHALFRLGKMTDHTEFLAHSERMLSRMKPMLDEVIGDLAHWARLHANLTYPLAEVVFVGSDALPMRREFVSRYIPNKITMGTTTSSELPLIQGKSAKNGRTMIYVCYDKTCKLPVDEVNAAYGQLK